jgi:hypothetical protein
MTMRPRLHASLVVLVLLGGCDALGVAAYKLHGPPKVPAKYVPRQAPTLVLVENYQHQSSAAAHADILAQLLATTFTDKKIAPMVPQEKLVELRDARGEAFKKMSISAIGREVGAAQVVYVQLRRSDVTPLSGGAGGGDALGGQADATVKVIDVASGDTMWPTDVAAEAGYPVAAATKMGASSRGGSVNDVRRKMYVELCDQIAKLFYKWQPDDMAPDTFSS